MAPVKTNILTAEQEDKLRQSIDEYVGSIQAKIDAIRADGTDKVLEIQSNLDSLKRDRIYTQQEKDSIAVGWRKELEKAKAVEAKNKAEIAKLIADAETYLKAHFNQDYFQYVAASCKVEKSFAQAK